MQQKKIILIDVGNTNTKIAIYDLKRIVNTFVLPTKLEDTLDTFGLRVVELVGYELMEPEEFEAWVVASVVPSLNGVIKRAGQKYFHCPVFYIPEDIDIPLENKYANPQEVGADRLVTAYAARQLYPESGLIVIDFGTATTLECICEHAYLGGLICPGLLSSLNALGGQTQKLPKISLGLTDNELQIGISTVTSLNHGFIHGFAGMVDVLCQKLHAFLPSPIKIIATGGFAENIQPISSCIQDVLPDLLMQGLGLVYKQRIS